MKIWKHCDIIGFLAILVIAVAFTACAKSKHTHDWGNWTLTTVPTCITEGVETRTCTLDPSHTETRTVAAIGHNWEDIITTFPTKTTNGIETRICTIDKTTETRALTLADLQTYFYGKWSTDDGNWVLTMTADLFEFNARSSYGTFGTADILEWAVTENKNINTKDEFPYGFTVSGTFIDHSDPYNIGNPTSPLIFINTTKNRLFFDTTAGFGYKLTKQGVN